MYKTSTEIGSISEITGEEKAVEFVAKAGFDAWDFTMFRMVDYNCQTNTANVNNGHPLSKDDAADFAKTLRKIGEDNGIYCNQSHAPFPTRCKEIRDLYKKSIELTAIAGGKICVIHPDNYKSAAENAEIYAELLPFAKQHGVKIAAENMWNFIGGKTSPAACSDEVSFKEHLDAVNDDYFVACVDIGHAEMAGLDTSAEKMLVALGDKVQCLHIHDNDLIHDSHQIPFSMNIDFAKVVNALKKIDYKGDLTLEASSYLSSRGYADRESVFNGVKELYASVKKLREMF